MCFITILSYDLWLDFWALRYSNVATLGLKAWLMEDSFDNPCEAFIALIEGKGVRQDRMRHKKCGLLGYKEMTLSKTNQKATGTSLMPKLLTE
jgi:hypothetical protein